MDDAAEGRGSCVIVEGPAGIGKSRLLEAAVARGAELGVAVGRGGATEVDRVAPLTTLLRPLQTCSCPELDVSGLEWPQRGRLGVIDQLRGVIEEFTRAQSLLVAIDDAQWSDELTALALRMLVPALSFSPVLWLLTRRPDTGSRQGTLDWLIDQGATRLRLGPLDDDGVARLCTNILGAPPDKDLLRLAARSEGNPFLLTELLGTLHDTAQIRVTAGTATVVSGELPAGFLDAVAWLLRNQPDEVHDLLNAGAVLGRPFTLHEAAGLAGRPTVELVPLADRAVAAGVLTETGSELTFCHDLIREAVYAGLPGPIRMALHREAADVVQGEGRSPVEAAEHLVRSGRAGAAQAVTVLDQAVQRLAPGAPGTAADLILRMLTLLDERHESRPELAASGVRLLASSGRVREARQLGERELNAGLPTGVEVNMLLGIAEALKHAGQNAAAVDYTRRALSRQEIPEPLRAQLLALQAHGLVYADDSAVADSVGTQAAEVGQAAGEYAAVVFGTVARSVAATIQGDLDEALSHAHEAVRVADAEGGEAAQRHPRLWLGAALTAVDRFTEAADVYEMGQREADRLGTAWSQPLWHYHRSVLRMNAGRLGDAEAEAEAGFRIAEQLSTRALTVPLLSMLAQVGLQRGETDLPQQHLQHAEQLLAEGISVAPEILSWPAASLHAALGKPKKAAETLADVYATLVQRPLLLHRDPGAAAELVRIARRADAVAEARTGADAARRLARHNPNVASLVGAAAHAEGLLEGNLEILRAAVHSYRSSPRPLARASALEDTAQAEHASGHRSAAVALLEEALQCYEASGAWRGAVRSERQLANLGAARHRPHDRQSLRVQSWDTLTESELRVARLVAQGLTNREVARQLFLSPHTVDSHIRHSFTKLGVTTRVELTRQVVEHDDAG